MKTILTLLFLVLAVSASNDTNNSTTASSSSMDTSTSSSMSGYYLMTDCKHAIGVSPDPCEMANSDWCCMYMKMEVNDVESEMYGCCWNPSKVNMDEMEVEGIDMDAISEAYCA